MTEPEVGNPTPSPPGESSEAGGAGANVSSIAEGTPIADGETSVAVGEQPVGIAEKRSLGLSFGVHLGTVVGLTLFAGMYMLSVHELRIASMVFTAGLSLGLVSAIIVVLMPPSPRREHDAAEQDVQPVTAESVWDAIGIGLGVILGSLPISLACSLFHWMPSFPRIVYVVGGIMLISVGVSRATSIRGLPSAVGQALIPGAAGVLVAHFVGDILYARMFFQ